MINEKYNIPSEIGAKSYWDNEGQFQSEYDKLYEELVPTSGEAKNLFGEAIRAVSRLGYEYLNNGNCQAYDAIIDLTVAVIVGEGTENSPELPEWYKDAKE